MSYVTDTHALIWYMTDAPELSEKVRKIFVNTDNNEESIYIPCIIFFELLYLFEKKKIAADFDFIIKKLEFSRNYRIEPLCLPIIKKSREVPRAIVKDPWDRLIAATSLHLNLPLISRDKILSKIGIKTIW
ncbi:MAG: hypothetical protein A2161_12825 [Candidatus Schekmanbacteria bacterium RBG_13_48_7]|uniref:PIN domain-containing protein n=1 Tax=Candidatus Schekmanbacteria bacterium RBG_13_48_7 TaxID=1817878 RepID=A0A1F7S305_9BACT|nr:MAG: hypothetical protein A2161_12825 [Candidatus Schekmanbacteria bacterium RBG_13_48_7]